MDASRYITSTLVTGAAGARRTPLARLARETRGVDGLRRVLPAVGLRAAPSPVTTVTFNSSI